MDPKESKFSWPILLIVTSACFFGFGMFIRLLDGHSTQAGLFFKVSIASFLLSIILFALQFMTRAADSNSSD